MSVVLTFIFCEINRLDSQFERKRRDRHDVEKSASLGKDAPRREIGPWRRELLGSIDGPILKLTPSARTLTILDTFQRWDPQSADLRPLATKQLREWPRARGLHALILWIDGSYG